MQKCVCTCQTLLKKEQHIFMTKSHQGETPGSSSLQGLSVVSLLSLLHSPSISVFTISRLWSSPWVSLPHCHHVVKLRSTAFSLPLTMATFKFQKTCRFAEPCPFRGVGAFLRNMIDVFSPNGSDGNTFFSIFGRLGRVEVMVCRYWCDGITNLT